MTDIRKSQSTFIPPVWVMTIINSLQQFFFKISKRMVPPHMWMMTHIENFWLSKAVAITAELNIAGHISEGKNTIAPLAAATQTNQDALYRLMRMLCANGIFKQSKSGIYKLTPYSEVLLKGKNSVKFLMESHLGKIHFDIFSEMKYTLQTGNNAAQMLFQKDIFSHIQEHADLQEVFIKGMADTSELFAPVLLTSYNFSPYNHIIDVGGGNGSLLCHILTKHKKLKATLFDNRHIVDRATENIKLLNLSDRIKITSGNFFESVPEGGDLYILKNILHDWDDDHNTVILNNINSVMPESAKLLVIDCVIKNNNSYSYGKMLDIMMMLGTKNGRERTEEEFDAIFKKSGFVIHRIIPTVSPFSLIECVKKPKSQ